MGPVRGPVAVLGTPAVAVMAAEALVEAGHRVVAAVTRPDARRGRGSEVSPSPLKAWALDRGVPVHHSPENLVSLGESEPVTGVVVAYGRLISATVLRVVPMVNIHFSLLPRWRGAAPVERAILAGDSETGVCIMRVEEGLDTGAVFARWTTPISAADTTASLTERLGREGARLLVETLGSGLGDGEPQTGDASYAAKIDASERLVDWSESAVLLERRVRALSPSTSLAGSRIKVLSATVSEDAFDGVAQPGTLRRDGSVWCGSGAIRLELVQPAGRRAMPARDWLAGVRWSEPMVLESLR